MAYKQKTEEENKLEKVPTPTEIAKLDKILHKCETGQELSKKEVRTLILAEKNDELKWETRVKCTKAAAEFCKDAKYLDIFIDGLGDKEIAGKCTSHLYMAANEKPGIFKEAHIGALIDALENNDTNILSILEMVLKKNAGALSEKHVDALVKKLEKGETEEFCARLLYVSAVMRRELFTKKHVDALAGGLEKGEIAIDCAGAMLAISETKNGAIFTKAHVDALVEGIDRVKIAGECAGTLHCLAECAPKLFTKAHLDELIEGIEKGATSQNCAYAVAELSYKRPELFGEAQMDALIEGLKDGVGRTFNSFALRQIASREPELLKGHMRELFAGIRGKSEEEVKKDFYDVLSMLRAREPGYFSKSQLEELKEYESQRH